MISRGFSQFINQQEILEESIGLPAYHLARFEDHLSMVMERADAQHLCLSDLASIVPEKWCELVFTFHPSVMSLNYHTTWVNYFESYNLYLMEK